MPINQSVFQEGATISVTGGSTRTLVSVGSSVSKNQFYVNEDASSLTRRKLKISSTEAKPNPQTPGGYTQERATLTYVVPKTLANGASTTNSFSGTFAVDRETTDAERVALIEEFCQMAIGTSFSDLFLRLNTQ